jgi:hypothetical protein
VKAALAALAAVVLLPVVFILALGGAATSPNGCAAAAAAPAETPSAGGSSPASGGLSILGPSTLTAEQLSAYWDARDGTQPAKLTVPIDTLIKAYIDAGTAEGVRGDVAFVQSLIETGWFTNGDTARNNFAGIAHYDNAPAGMDFPTAAAGATGQIQLLKRYAAGNDVKLALTDYAPRAGARATTFEQLAGTWATDTTYGTKIVGQYQRVLEAAGASGPAQGTCPEAPPSVVTVNGELATVNGITVAVEIAPQLQSMINAAAADGLTLTGGGFRDPAEQIALRRAHCGSTYYAIYQAPSSSCRPPTARPGSSQHELGLAIDFRCNGSSIGQYDDSNPCFIWLTANAGRYGFKNLPSENWHWSTTGS